MSHEDTPRLVSITRILNEDDIVEAFVRHNATHIQHMLFIDNGSVDSTLDILKALKNEGFSLSVFRSPSIIFEEIATNTWAYKIASQLFAADWVVFLDADEFIDTQGGGLLSGFLSGTACVIELVNYVQTEWDDAAELSVPVRQRWRDARKTNVHKLLLRSNLPGVSISAGNHTAMANGSLLSATKLSNVIYAHYPRRSGWQILHKFTAGWLKVQATGSAATLAGHSAHYRSPFETLRDKPAELLSNPEFFVREAGLNEAVEKPLDYRGGELQYTKFSDPALKAAQGFLFFVERLAIQQGRLLDHSQEARLLVDSWNSQRVFLF